MKPAVIVMMVAAACIVALVQRPHRNNGETRVAVVLFDHHAVIDEIAGGFVAQLNAQAARRSKKVTYDTRSADGNKVQAETIARYFRDADVDMIFVVGIPAAQALKTAGVTKPVIFGGPPDPVAAGLVPSLTNHGTNFTGTKYFPSQAVTVAVLGAARPQARRLAVLHNPGEANSAALVKGFGDAASAKSLYVRSFPVSNTLELEAALKAINPGDIDAVFLPTDNFVYSALDRIIQGCREKGLDTFSVTRLAVEHGAIFAVGADYRRVGERTADVAAQILFDGKSPREVDVLTIEEGKLFVGPGVNLSPPAGYEVVRVDPSGGR